MINVEAFVSRMTERWSTTLGNVPNDNLKAVWRQACETYNRTIQQHGTKEGERWKVLQPATGTGKTQGLCLYAAMIPIERHPGALIVVRLVRQAIDVAATINELAGVEVAAAFHHECELSRDDIAKMPVLVITHRRFVMGLDAVNLGTRQATNWEGFTAWGDGQRKLVVIDEALDIVEEAQVSVDQARRVRGMIPLEVAQRHPKQLAEIEALERVLTEMAERPGTDGHERMLWPELDSAPESFDMTELRREMKARHWDLKRPDLDDEYDFVLKAIQQNLAQWNWYAKKKGEHTINTARHILPESCSGAVILDATAGPNLIYQLFDGKVDVVPVPSIARRYDNVTLHSSAGHRTGKHSRIENAADDAATLIANLEERLGTDRRVLVVTHQGVVPHLKAHAPHFAAFDIAYWNALDGLNKWDTYDTVVVFSLPHRDPTWSANTFMAFQGWQSTEWLRSDGDRPFKDFRDIRRSLNTGQLVVQVVQAINRVRCRRVIDGEGNCAPTDVFLLLPSPDQAAPLLAGIEKEMPGVKRVQWDYRGAKRKAIPHRWEEALASYVQTMKQGTQAALSVMQSLGIQGTARKRIWRLMRNPLSELSRRLATLGITWSVPPDGRLTKATLVKS